MALVKSSSVPCRTRYAYVGAVLLMGCLGCCGPQKAAVSSPTQLEQEVFDRCKQGAEKVQKQQLDAYLKAEVPEEYNVSPGLHRIKCEIVQAMGTLHGGGYSPRTVKNVQEKLFAWCKQAIDAVPGAHCADQQAQQGLGATQHAQTYDDASQETALYRDLLEISVRDIATQCHSVEVWHRAIAVLKLLRERGVTFGDLRAELLFRQQAYMGNWRVWWKGRHCAVSSTAQLLGSALTEAYRATAWEVPHEDSGDFCWDSVRAAAGQYTNAFQGVFMQAAYTQEHQALVHISDEKARNRILILGERSEGTEQGLRHIIDSYVRIFMQEYKQGIVQVLPDYNTARIAHACMQIRGILHAVQSADSVADYYCIASLYVEYALQLVEAMSSTADRSKRKALYSQARTLLTEARAVQEEFSNYVALCEGANAATKATFACMKHDVQQALQQVRDALGKYVYW